MHYAKQVKSYCTVKYTNNIHLDTFAIPMRCRSCSTNFHWPGSQDLLLTKINGIRLDYPGYFRAQAHTPEGSPVSSFAKQALENASIKAMKLWRFEPRRVKGKAVDTPDVCQDFNHVVPSSTKR